MSGLSPRTLKIEKQLSRSCCCPGDNAPTSGGEGFGVETSGIDEGPGMVGEHAELDVSGTVVVEVDVPVVAEEVPVCRIALVPERDC